MQLLMVEIKQWSLAGFIFGFGWFFVFVCLCVCSGLVRTFPSLGREKQHIQLVCVGRYTYGIVLTSRYQQKEKKLKEGIGILGSFFFCFFPVRKVLFENFRSDSRKFAFRNPDSFSQSELIGPDQVGTRTSFRTVFLIFLRTEIAYMAERP